MTWSGKPAAAMPALAALIAFCCLVGPASVAKANNLYQECREFSATGAFECVLTPLFGPTEWEYFFPDWPAAQNPYSAEQDAVERKKIQIADAYSGSGKPLCGPVSVTVRSDWEDRTYFGFDWKRIPSWQRKSFYFSWTYRISGGACSPAETSSHLYRTRLASCDDGKGFGDWRARNDGTVGTGYCRRKLAQTCPVNNPVHPDRGERGFGEVDVRFGEGYVFERRYRSHSVHRVWSPESVVTKGSFGQFWQHNFERSIEVVRGGAAADAAIKSAVLHAPEGKSYFYPGGTASAGRQTYSSPAAQGDQLVALVNPLGEITGWEYRGSNDSFETYETGGRLLTLKPRGRPAMRFEYGADRLTAIIDPYGRRLSLSYDDRQRIAAIEDPAGGRYDYGYDATDNLTTVTYPVEADGSRKTRSYQYQDAGYENLLTSITDENGKRFATYSYDSKGRAVRSVNNLDSGGVVNAVDYDYSGGATQTKVTDALGTQRTYTFADASGIRKLTGTSAPCATCGGSSSQTLSYDANGNLASRSDFNGKKICYSYDQSRSLEIRRIEGLSSQICSTALSNPPTGASIRLVDTTWHPLWRQPSVISESNRRTEYSYDGDGNRTSEIVTDLASGQTRTTSYAYMAGRPASIDGPRTDVTNVTTFAYDVQGNLIRSSDALGHITEITQNDAHGNPLRIVDPNGLETLLTYDARQRLKTRAVGGETTTFDYDGVGQLIKITQPDGSFIAYTYDAAHRLTDITDQSSNRIHYTLDNAGNRTAEEVYAPANTLRRIQTKVYDALSRLKELRGGNGQLTSYTYDPNGNRLTESVAGTGTTTNQYDALNRLFRTTDAANGITQYGFNARDEITSVTDPRGKVTSYTRNAFGEVTQLSSPDTGTTLHTYDSAGNLKTRTDAKGQLASYSYDALNRVTQIVYTGGPTVTYEYDQGAYGKGRLTGLSDASGTTAWTYDALGRITGKTQIAGGLSRTISYAYDLTGHLISQTLPSGRVLNFSHTAGQISGISVDGLPITNNISHQPFGEPRDWTFGNGQQSSRSYDLSGRMTAHALATIGYDSSDRITQFDHSGLSILSGSKNYGYDSLDRLTAYSTPSTTLGYAYDANGNRTQQTGTAGTITSTIDNTSNRLTALTDSGGTHPHTYDANGSLISDGTRTFGYDASGRMTSANTTTTYSYNAQGQRTVKSTPTTTTVFVYDEQGHLLGEYNAGGHTETIWLGNTPLAVLMPSGGIYYVHADHLNTLRQIDDAQGNAVWAWDTQTFGENAPDEDPGNTGTSFSFNLRHPGQYADAETGLFQNWWRDYDPSLGRYVQSDPIGLRGGVNTYGYAEQNPLRFIDPLGLATCTCNPPQGGAARTGSEKICNYSCRCTDCGDSGSKSFSIRHSAGVSDNATCIGQSFDHITRINYERPFSFDTESAFDRTINIDVPNSFMDKIEKECETCRK